MTELPEGFPEIPGYSLIRRLGAGGMANVYLAEHLALHRQVAVKVHNRGATGDESTLLRFEQEARVIARLDHPNIVTVYEVGRTARGELFYAMAYLPRGDLRRQEGIDDLRLIEIAQELLDALDYAHAQGIVHRDIKPENILFDQFERPLLADFGIAYSQGGHERITGVGSAVGSSGYMSPEQARGEVIDGRADLYSLGVVLFEQLAGQLPFHGSDPLAMALAHQQDPVPALPPLKRRWQGLINRVLAKRASSRFQSAGELNAALDTLAEQLAAGEQRHALTRGLMAMLIAAGLVVVLLGVLLLRSPPQTDLLEPVTVELPLQTDAESSVPDSADDAAELQTLSIDEFDSALRRISAAIDAGNWFDAEDSASQQLAALFEVYPGLPEGRAALQQLVDTLLPYWLASRPVPEPEAIDHWLNTLDGLFAGNSEGLDADAPSREFEQALIDELSRFSNRVDRQGVDRLRDITEVWRARSPQVEAVWSAIVAEPSSGDRLRDPDGPELIYLAAEHAGGQPFALMRHELSRDEWSFFASETRRPASDCREPSGLIARFRRHDWRDPGFAQGGDHPVVCVSWNDARDYALWLSRRTGYRYRLPTQDEWLRAAARSVAGGPCQLGNVLDRTAEANGDSMDCSDGHAHTAPRGLFAANDLGFHDFRGNVSEWVADCAASASGNSGTCSRRLHMGPSWRDGRGQVDVQRRGERAPERGVTTVGFRLLREID